MFKALPFAVALVCSALGFANTAHALDPLQGLPAEVKALHTTLITASRDTLCDTDLPTQNEIWSINGNYTVYIVPCAYGSAQTTSYGYITDTRAPGKVVPLMVLAYDRAAGKIVSSLELQNVALNTKTGVLSTSQNEGDGCGQLVSSKISVPKSGVILVRTTSIEARRRCDGNRNAAWPVVFKQ